MLKKLCASTLLFLFGIPALANCLDLKTQADMNACAAAEFTKADAKLNAAYKKLVPLLDAKQKAEVKAIQLAWIKFKEANCKFESSSAEGGSMQPLLRSTCLTNLTESRTKDLNNWIQSFGQ
jgi:uncharacterized protein YecT (DUF1311 family)